MTTTTVLTPETVEIFAKLRSPITVDAFEHLIKFQPEGRYYSAYNFMVLNIFPMVLKYLNEENIRAHSVEDIQFIPIQDLFVIIEAQNRKEHLTLKERLLMLVKPVLKRALDYILEYDTSKLSSGEWQQFGDALFLASIYLALRDSK